MATSTDLRAAIEEVQLSLPGAEAIDIQNYDQKGALDEFSRRLGAMPWWVISTAVHSVIFLLCSLLVVNMSKEPPDTWINTTFRENKRPKFKERVKSSPFEKPVTVKSDHQIKNPIVTRQPQDPNVIPQTANDMDTRSMKGSPGNISEIPLGQPGVHGVLGVGTNGLSGTYGYRLGGREHAVRRFGGSEKTENAVEAALEWLARHQEKDGSWDPGKWEGNAKYPVSMTGIALLAFLGAGYTEKTGKYRDNVRRAQNWMVSRVQGGKRVGGGKGRAFVTLYGKSKLVYPANMYEQGMATLALAEAYGMTKNPHLKDAAQDAVNYILKAQGSYEAWSYGTKHGRAGRNDTSVSGWNLMALKSAKMAGLKVDGAGFQGAMRWASVATDPATGKCAYAGTVGGVKPGRGSDAMCAAGMLMKQFMGVRRDDRMIIKSADHLRTRLPRWGAGGKYSNLYYWYYGTLCMFQMGGKHWAEWNVAIKKTLLENQRKGGPMDGSALDVDGSWDPTRGGKVNTGGRVFSTALGALSLEVYYRYLPLYGK